MPLMPDVTEWTYSGDPGAGDLDQVRFWLQDTDPDVRLLSDQEIGWLIAQWKNRYDSLVYVAAVAAEQVANKFAGVVSVSADGVSVNVADISSRYREVATRLRQVHKDAQVGGEIDIMNLLWGSRMDHGIAPLTFGMKLFDNPGAGRQDYGGDHFDPWADAAERAGG